MIQPTITEIIEALNILQNPKSSTIDKEHVLNEYWDHVCRALGHERTRNELIPCIREVAFTILLRNENQIDSSFLITLVSLIEKSLDHVGGPKYVECLLELLTELCESSDIEIRQSAIHVFVSLVQNSLPNGFDGIVHQIDHLLTSESPALQITSCHLCPLLLTFGCANNRNMMQSFFQGFLDSFKSSRAAVRREAVLIAPKVLTQLISQLNRSRTPSPKSSSNGIETEKNQRVGFGSSNRKRGGDKTLIELLKKMIDQIVEATIELSSDVEEATRVNVMSSISQMLLKLKVQKDLIVHYENLKTTLIRAGEDTSWMVRCAVVKLLLEINDSSEIVNTIHRLSSFLNDSEAEVRIASIYSINKLVNQYSEEIRSFSFEKQSEVLELLRSIFFSLANDSNVNVRISVAEHIVTIANHFNVKIAIQSLFAVFLRFLRDDAPDVRLEAFKSLSSSPSDDLLLNKDASRSPSSSTIKKRFLMGVKDPGPSSLASALEPVLSDTSWRLRQTAITVGASVLQYAPVNSEIHQWLEQLILNSLRDSVYSVRVTAAQAIGELAISLGVKWVNLQVFQRIDQLQSSSNYLHRITLGLVIKALILAIFPRSQRLATDQISIFKTKLNEVTINLSKDPISNVRINLLRCLKESVDQFTKSEEAHSMIQSLISNLINHMKNDKDDDVRLLVEQFAESSRMPSSLKP